jgi:hypothetical protein
VEPVGAIFPLGGGIVGAIVAGGIYAWKGSDKASEAGEMIYDEVTK